jgi:hypothetical protein
MTRARGLLIMMSLGLGLLYGLHRAVQHAGAHPPGTPEPSGASTASAAGLREEIARLRRVNRGPRRDDVGVTGDLAATPPVAPAVVPEYRAYIAGLEAALRRENVDPEWARSVSAAIHDAIAADAELASLARDVECRSHTCRVELADDTVALGKSLPRFLQQLGAALPGVVADHVDDHGEATLVLFLSRAGAAAP